MPSRKLLSISKFLVWAKAEYKAKMAEAKERFIQDKKEERAKEAENREKNKQIKKADSSLNREIKKENYRDVQDKIAEDVPYISLCYRNFVLLMNKNLVGEMKPQFFNPYRGIENISLKKNK